MQFHPTTLQPERRADHRGLPRRGRLPAQRRGRPVHVQLRAERAASSPRATSSRGRSRPRSTRAAASTAACCSTSRHLGAKRIMERLHGSRELAMDYRRRRPDRRADPGAARRPLPHGRRRHGHVGAHRSCPASTPPASPPASRCTARTGWAATRCSRPSCSAAAPAPPPHRTCVRTARGGVYPPAAVRATERKLQAMLDAERPASGRTRSARSWPTRCTRTSASSAPSEKLEEAKVNDRRDARALRPRRRWCTTRAARSTPT